MSVKDVKKFNARQLDTLRRRQAREISQMEEGHRNVKAELKESHKDEILDLHDENKRAVAKENDKKEKLLAQMRNQLDETERLTQKELEDLKKYSTKAKADEHAKLSLDRERIKEENELYLEDLTDRFQTQTKKVNLAGQKQVADLTDERQRELSEKEGFYQDKISHQTNDFTVRFQNDSKNYQRMKDTQDLQFKKDRLNANTRQQEELNKMTSGHMKAVEIRDTDFRRAVKDQDLMFEKKYAESLKTQNEMLKNLSDRHTKVTEQLKADLQEKLTTAVTRSDDPFYKFTDLKPRLKEFPDKVEIEVDIPEHSKQDVSLSIHNKEAIINFNRRYDDSKKTEAGQSKLHKVESFTSRVLTSHFLDAKSVKSSYNNGVMTYVINRA